PVHADERTVAFNVGVGLWREDSGAGRNNVSDYFDRFLAGNRVPRDLHVAARYALRPVGYPVGLGLWRNRVVEGRVLRIGDAANLAHPLSRERICNRLCRACLA